MLDDLYKSELQDRSYTGGQSISASEAETWKRRLMNIMQETLRDMEDQKVQAEARMVLQRVSTPCVEQYATQQAVTGERFKRKFGAADVNVVDGLAVHHSKRGKSSTGSLEENDRIRRMWVLLMSRRVNSGRLSAHHFMLHGNVQKPVVICVNDRLNELRKEVTSFI